MQRAGRVCGCGERQDASGIEAQCATATRTPRCRRPHRSTELARFPPGGPPRFVAIGRGHFVRRGRRRAACRHTAPPTRRPRRSDMSGAAPRRAPLVRGAGPSDDGQASDRQAADTPSIDQPISRPTIAPRSAHDRPTRSASNRPACAIVHSKPRGRHGSRAHAPSTDAACAPRVGRTGRRAVTPPDTARASAHTARAASTARDRHRARAPRDTASAGRPDARGRPSRDRAAPR